MMAQTVTYSEDFIVTTTYGPGSTQTDNWEVFRDALTGTYSELRLGGSNGPDTSCTDPAAITAIANALNTDTTASIPCDGNIWQVGICGGIELSLDVAICTCQAASEFTLRPNTAVGDNWGGIGGTCGAASGGGPTQNVSQTLTVLAIEAAPPTDADISLTLTPASTSPTVGSNIFIDVDLNNVGPAAGTGVSVDFDLPSGLTFVSDDAGGAYNPATGVWTVGTITPGSNPRLRVIVEVESTGSYALLAEVLTANENDTDSTPGNAATNPGEDDTDTITLTPTTPPPPLFCLGRPIQPLVFVNPIADSPGANLASPQVGDVFRFPNASPGVDALVEVIALNNGASLIGIDNDGTPTAPIGIADNFQPTLVGPAGDISADFQFTFVSSGTSIPGTLDFAGSVIDVDGDSVGLREYIEVSNNIVEFALNGVPVPSDPTGPATRLITQANTPPDPGASAPSSGGRIRFEAETVDTAAGIDPNEPRNIAAAFFTDVSVFEYRIGKFGDATTGRLNSLAFNCPAIDPSTTNPAALEDFGDAPLSYGNPIHVVDPAVQLGPTNTDETGPGDSATASTDAADDGVTLPASFQGGVQVTFDVDARGAGGFLQGFFDWNRDGDFEDAGEQTIVDVTDNDANDATPISITITPPVDIVEGSSFARFRWATASGVGIEDPAGDGEVEDYQITLVAPILALTKTASATPVIEESVITYTLVVSETAGVDATNIQISDTLPAGLTFVSANDGGVFDGVDTITWTLPGPLNASGPTPSLSVSFEASADQVSGSATVTNTASATSTEVSIPVTASETITVNDAPVPPPAPSSCTGTDLAINGGFETPDVPGTNAFAIFPSASVPGWTATGGQTEIELWDSGHTGFTSDTGLQHAELNAVGAGGLATDVPVASRAEVLYFWSHRARAVDGETATLSFTDDAGGASSFGDYSSNIAAWNAFSATYVTSPGATTLTAEHATILGGSLGNFHDSIQACQTFITLNKAELSRQDLDLDGGDSLGDTVTYRYTISNPTGNARSLASVVINDDKIGVIGVPMPDSGDTNSDGLLDPGETWVFDADYTLVQADIDAGAVTNIAFAEAETSDNTLRTDDQTVTVTLLTGMAELEASKTVSIFDPLNEDLFAVPGNDVIYTITVSNVGDGETDDGSIFLVDRLPDEAIFFNGDADGPGPGLDPVNFTDIVPTGLDPFVFADSIGFAGAGAPPATFADCSLPPQPGFDPDVRYVCFNPAGMMQAGDPDPSFSFSFRVRIR